MKKRHLVPLLLIALSLSVYGDNERFAASLHIAPPFFHVGDGWRVVYEVHGRLFEDALHLEQGLLFEKEGDGHFVGLGTNDDIRALANFLATCAIAIEANQSFEKQLDLGKDLHLLTVRYVAGGDGLRISSVDPTKEGQERVFASAVIPSQKTFEFADAVGRIEDQHQRINAKLKQAQQVEDADAE